MTTVPPVDDSRLLDLFKLAVEMADRVSARRGTANVFFLTVQTAFVTVLGITAPDLARSPWWVNLTVGLAGLALSASWWLQLRSYRDLSPAKFAVINGLEKQLPVRVFTEEWAILTQGRMSGWRGKYAELGAVERIVPALFAVLYVLLFVGRIAG